MHYVESVQAQLYVGTGTGTGTVLFKFNPIFWKKTLFIITGTVPVLVRYGTVPYYLLSYCISLMLTQPLPVFQIVFILYFSKKKRMNNKKKLCCAVRYGNTVRK